MSDNRIGAVILRFSAKGVNVLVVNTTLAGFARILGNQGRKASHESFVIKFYHPVEIVKRYAAFLVERVLLVCSIF